MSAKTKFRQGCGQDLVICPEKAFALSLILCTVSVRQSILTGILIVWLLLFCQLLKNILCSMISETGCRAAVSVAAAAVSFCLFRVTDYAAGLWEAGQGFSFTLYGIFAGLLTADAVLNSGYSSEWNENHLLTRSALLWMAMILTGIARELLAFGSLLDVRLTDFQSTVFAGPAFGLIFAAFALAACDIGRQPARESFCSALYPVAALLILCPAALGHGNGAAAQIAGILTVFLFHASARYRLAYSELPVSSLSGILMATGFFYMIL